MDDFDFEKWFHYNFFIYIVIFFCFCLFHKGIFARLSYIDGKKASEAKTLTTENNGRQLNQSIKSYPYLSNSATLLDVFGYYRSIDELTVRAGIYSLLTSK